MDTKKELAKIAAKAKEKQREHGGTAPGRTLCQISDEQVNQRLSEGAGNKGCQISDNLKIDTKKELAKIAGDQFRRFEGATYRGPCRSAAVTLI